jgi:hypothetical protein
MKKIIYISFFLISFFASCVNETINKGKTDNNTKQKEILKNDKTDAMCPTLLKEIENFITYNDSVDRGGSISEDVYIVYLYRKKTVCYVTILQSLCYYQSLYPQSISGSSCNIDGFVLLNNKMIAFYNLKNDCNKGLVDITKLKKGKPKDFPDENSDIARYTTYDPIGKKYKIHSKDSLELVYFGYF